MDNRIVFIDIVDGELIVTYQDGSTQSLGPISEMDLEQLTAAVVKNAGDIVGLKRADTALQTSVAALETAVTAAETAIEGAEDDIDDLGAEVTGLMNDLNQFPNGTYPNMSVGNADQLTATVGIEDNAPYLFRTSGGSNDIGDREDVKKLVGGTIANNQLIPTANKDFTNNVTDTRAYIYLVIRLNSSPYTAALLREITAVGKYEYVFSANYTGKTEIIHSGSTANFSFYGGNDIELINGHKYLFSIGFMGVDLTTVGGVTSKDMMLADLTQDFGTSIADYVYSLETATAGSGVAWLKKHFPKQFDSGYQAYDAGSLQSVSGLTEHKMVGFNQWDEEWEVGVYDTNTGAPVSVNTNIRSKSTNYIPVVPGTVYYFNTARKLMEVYQYRADKSYIGKFNVTDNTATLDVACCFLRFDVGSSYGTTYNHDICINLHWDGEKDGTYEPYKTWSYALDDSVVIRGIPKVDANGNLYYDGDEYLPDGTVNRRFGIVDMGTLTWEAISGYAGFFKAETTEIINTPNGILANALCPKYVTVKGNELSTKDKAIAVGMNNAYQIQVSDSAHSTSSASDFKTAMSGVMLLYEKRLPTTETAEPYQSTQIVDDFGTEEFVLADGAFPVPVGHNTMYQNNLRAKLEMSPDSPDGDGLYVVQQESGENTYVPLASTATIQDILTRLTALENA